MNIELKFKDLDLASRFAGILREENLRGVKVNQGQKKVEDGSLDLEEWLPVINIVIQSGLATSVVTSVFGLLKGLLVENRKIKTNAEIEKKRIESIERIEMIKMTKKAFVKSKKNVDQTDFVEFILENDNKKINFKLIKGNKKEQVRLLQILNEMTN